MKIKAGATIGVFLCSALLSSPRSYASEPARERVVQRFPDSGDHELGPAVFVDKSTTAIGSLRLPALSDESRTEKRSVPLAEPKDTLCGLKGVMSKTGSRLSANIEPANAIRTAPTIKSARRPNLSATAVMMMVITAPPASAAVKIQPIAAGLSPTVSR